MTTPNCAAATERRTILDRLDALERYERNRVAEQDALRSGQRDALPRLRDDDADEARQEQVEEEVKGIAMRVLDEIDAARRRVDAGTYGTCASCGEAIDAARLASHPVAARCTACQEVEERLRPV